jgi:hypothetical protein
MSWTALVVAFGLDIARAILFMKPKNYVARVKGRPVDLTKKSPSEPKEEPR